MREIRLQATDEYGRPAGGMSFNVGETRRFHWIIVDLLQSGYKVEITAVDTIDVASLPRLAKRNRSELSDGMPAGSVLT